MNFEHCLLSSDSPKQLLQTIAIPCFVGTQFEEFLTRNGVKHLMSAPYHPASNSLAERAVQLVKGAAPSNHYTMQDVHQVQLYKPTNRNVVAH